MKNVTLEKISRATGFSIRQVGRALSGTGRIAPETRRRICAAAEALGYQSHGVHTSRVAIITPCYFHWVERLLGELRFRGLEGTVFLMDALDILPERLFDGAIAICCHNSLPREWSKRFRLPLVLVYDNALYSEAVSAVAVDCNDEMQQAVTHLVHLGHRRIVWMREQSVIGEDRRYRNRGTTGFHGPVTPSGFMLKLVIRDFDCNAELLALVKEACAEGYTGFIINEFRYYPRLLRAFADCGRRIPEDISLIVYDCDGTTQYYQPPLTALAIDYDTINRLAIEMLFEYWNGNDETRQVLVPSRLIVRQSTGARRP